MKTQIAFRFAFLFMALVIISHSFAQKTSASEIAMASYKGGAAAYGAVNSEAKKSSDNMNIKVQRSFLSYFKSATKASWDMIGHDFLVNFKNEDGHTRALFSKKGNLLYTINYGTEKDLPNDIDEQVRSNYFNYQITYAIQVLMNKQNVWVVSLKDKTQYLILRIQDGKMDVMQQYHE